MGNIFTLLQEIFMMKEDNSSKIGLSDLKEPKYVMEKPETSKQPVAKELRLSDLMRHGSY